MERESPVTVLATKGEVGYTEVTGFQIRNVGLGVRAEGWWGVPVVKVGFGVRVGGRRVFRGDGCA